MAIARKRIIDESEVGTYLITNRCVRRAFLMGEDFNSGEILDFRRAWVEEWLESLAEVMLIDILDFCVMSNHYHLVLRNRPDLLDELSDEECARRLALMYPGVTCLDRLPDEECPLRVQEMLADSNFENKRRRLTSISSFMAIWQEAIAKRANLEDDCTGHFWEGRFHSVKLLDSIAVLYAFAYVDLNPVKANLTSRVCEAKHTGLKLRWNAREASRDTWLTPFDCREHADGCLPMTLEEFVNAIQKRADAWLANKHTTLSVGHPKRLCELGISKELWSSSIDAVVSGFKYMMGGEESMTRQAAADGKQWYAGISTARALTV